MGLIKGFLINLTRWHAERSVIARWRSRLILGYLDVAGEIGAEFRTRELVILVLKEGHRTRRGANPDFSGACIEIESHLFLNFRLGVTGRQNLNTDFRRGRETNFSLHLGHPRRRGPGHIGCFNTISGGNWAFSEDS